MVHRQPPTKARSNLLALPTSYTIYVDGGWDSTDMDFYSAFQEQRDPTNRRGSAGIAIIPTGTDWQQQGASLCLWFMYEDITILRV